MIFTVSPSVNTATISPILVLPDSRESISKLLTGIVLTAMDNC